MPDWRIRSLANALLPSIRAGSADGPRQKKVVGATTTNLVWGDQNVLRERDGGLPQTAQYVHFPGFRGGLVAQRRSTTSRFHGFGGRDNTRALVNMIGMMTDRYSYMAFGS